MRSPRCSTSPPCMNGWRSGPPNGKRRTSSPEATFRKGDTPERSSMASIVDPLVQDMYSGHADNAKETGHDHPHRRKAESNQRHGDKEVNNGRVDVDHGPGGWPS